MRIKISFDKNTEEIKNIRPLINGFVNECLGEDNPYHGNFSRYNISTMIGGKLNGNHISYDNGGYIYISSDDEQFISNLIEGIFNKRPSVGNMKYLKFDIEDFMVNNNYDIIRTTSPIALKYNNSYITYNDPNFLPVLIEKSKKKLLNCGYSENDVNTLSIEPFHFENAKVCYADTKESMFTPSSKVMFIVRGKQKIRKALYELGLGCNTGYGFGSISINCK